MNVAKELQKYKDKRFREFQINLVPNIDPKTIIGVKSPNIRKIAKEVFASGEYIKYMSKLPHKYLEENMLHSFLIGYIKDYKEAINALKIFSPYMDNWMVTDTIASKTFEKNKDLLIKDIYKLLKTNKTYSVRVAIILLKKYYLNDDFDLQQLNAVVSVKNKDYYTQMMISWYMAEGLIKKEKYFLNIIKSKKLPLFIQNKTIQKARDSFRISKTLKKKLLLYKV